MTYYLDRLRELQSANYQGYLVVVLQQPQSYHTSGVEVLKCVYAKTIKSALNCSLYNSPRHGCAETSVRFLLKPVPFNSNLELYPDFRSEPIYDDRYFATCGVDPTYFWDNNIFGEELEQELINRGLLQDFSQVLVEHPEWDDGNDYYIPSSCPFFCTQGPVFLIQKQGSAFKIKNIGNRLPITA